MWGTPGSPPKKNEGYFSKEPKKKKIPAEDTVNTGNTKQ